MASKRPLVVAGLIALAIVVNVLTLSIAAFALVGFGPAEGDTDVPEYADGDGIVVSRLGSPGHGDEAMFEGDGGDLVGVVGATPGDRAEAVDGALMVNGTAVDVLDGAEVPEEAAIDLDDEYLILRVVDGAAEWHVVADGDVRGRVLGAYSGDNASAGLQAALALGLVALLAMAAGCAAGAFWIAGRRGRSAWWLLLGLLFLGPGVLVTYLFIERRDSAARAA